MIDGYILIMILVTVKFGIFVTKIGFIDNNNMPIKHCTNRQKEYAYVIDSAFKLTSSD